MRVTIAGAGAVGRSIAGELLANGHSVMLIEKDGRKVRTRAVPGAEWVQADACEVTSLEEAQLASSDVAIAATGDDKANLVFALLAKTEFAVNRVVARVKEPRNEWLYTEAWGVDVAVSTPRVLAALVEEAVTVGDVVRLMSFRKGAANLVEITLAEDTPWVGKPLREVPLPRETVLTAILRGERVITPSPDEPLEAGDELLFVAHAEVEEQLQAVLAPGLLLLGLRAAVPVQPGHHPQRDEQLDGGDGQAEQERRGAQQPHVVALVEQPLHGGTEQEGAAPQGGQPGVGAQHPGVLAPVQLRRRVRFPAVLGPTVVQGRAHLVDAVAQPGQPVRRHGAEVAGGQELRDDADQRPAEEDRPHQDDADRGVAQDAEHEEVAGLPGGRGDGDGDPDADQAADALLDALPPDDPQQEHEDGDTQGRPDADLQPAEGVGEDERDSRQRRIDHPAPAAELLEHEVAVEDQRRAARLVVVRTVHRRSPHPGHRRSAVTRRPARSRGCT
jgi:trk system potassium uptake protein TrkA